MMRKILFVLFMAFLLPLSAFEMNADDENVDKPIPLKIEQGTKLNRTLVQESLQCYYYGMLNTIVTTAYEDLGYVSLTVTNCSTGSVWYDMFDSAQEPQTMLSLSGEPGIYEVVYITESGDVYEGNFILE